MLGSGHNGFNFNPPTFTIATAFGALRVYARIIWLMKSGGGKRQFLGSEEKTSYLIEVLRRERVKKIFFMKSHFLYFIRSGNSWRRWVLALSVT